MTRNIVQDRAKATRRGVARAKTAVAALTALGLTAAVGGCGVDFFGDGEAPPLEGERIPVLGVNRGVTPDPSVAGLTVTTPRALPNTDWPQPDGVPSHELGNLEGSTAFNTVWRTSVGAGSSSYGRLLSPPIVTGGRIYTLDAEGTVSAFTAADGARIWTASLAPEDVDEEKGFGGGVTYDRGRLFAATGFGVVVALDPAGGAEIWRRRVSAPVRAAPIAYEGRVFVVTIDNQLYALDAGGGDVLWTQRSIVESAGLLAAPAPAAVGDALIAPFSSGELMAVLISNGREIWTDSLTRSAGLTPLTALSDIAGSPVVAGGRIYAISHAGRFVSIDLRSGQRIWTRDIAGINTPLIAGDFIYVVTVDGEVVCLTRNDGLVRWVAQLPRWTDPEDKEGLIEWSGPIMVGGQLVLASSEGEIRALSAENGETVNSAELPDRVMIAPIVADGTLYVLTDEAELIALR